MVSIATTDQLEEDRKKKDIADVGIICTHTFQDGYIVFLFQDDHPKASNHIE